MPVTIDNDTQEIITFTPEPDFGGQGYVPPNSGAGDHVGQTGFGPTRKMLDIEPIRTAPWLTPELAEQEMAIGGFK